MKPHSGPGSGSTSVTIVGSGFFQTSQALVRFVLASNATFPVAGTYLSSSEMLCVSPSVTTVTNSGPATVSVALNGQQFTATTTVFTYFGALCVAVVLVQERSQAG
jgi:hypothetical protein